MQKNHTNDRITRLELTENIRINILTYLQRFPWIAPLVFDAEVWASFFLWFDRHKFDDDGGFFVVKWALDV